MNPKLEETIYLDFIASSPTTGAAADADSTPTAEVFEDATDTAVLSPTVTKRTSKTGNYRVPVACTAANGFEAGKSYNVVASATVGGVAAKAVIGRFQVRTRSVDDASTYAGGDTAGTTTLLSRLTSQRATNLDNLDAAITSRMATYVQPTGFLTATFPSVVASTTNITAGIITTVTNLTNLPTMPTDWITAAGLSAGAVAEVQSGLSTYAGGDTAGTTTLLARIGSALTITGGAVNLNFAQVGLSPRALDSVLDGALTTGDALVAALCGAAGKEQVAGTAYLVKTPSTGTTIRTFTLNDATTPTQRT